MRTAAFSHQQHLIRRNLPLQRLHLSVSGFGQDDKLSSYSRALCKTGDESRHAVYRPSTRPLVQCRQCLHSTLNSLLGQRPKAVAQRDV